MSWRCSSESDGQAGLGEAAVYEVAAVLDAVWPRRMRWTRCSGVLRRCWRASRVAGGTRSLRRIEVGCVGWQVVGRRPVPGLRELPQVGDLVDVEVVPDEYDRATELPGGRRSAGPGSRARISSRVRRVPAWPVDRPRPNEVTDRGGRCRASHGRDGLARLLRGGSQHQLRAQATNLSRTFADILADFNALAGAGLQSNRDEVY